MRLSRLSTIAAPLFALLLGAPLESQVSPFGWLGDDGMNIGCCVPVNQVAIPQFPSFQISGLYGSIKDCALEQEFQVRVATQHVPMEP